MHTIEAYYYRGMFYTWYHESQNEYSERHISIQSAVSMINRDDSVIIEQTDYSPPRYKYIGHGQYGIITVIMDGNRIVTAWNSSAAEVKLWLSGQGK